MSNNRQTNNKFIPDVNKVRVFQIGFNKCGTRTLFKFFQKNNVPSVHYDGGQIAGSLYRHYQNKDPLIDIRYRKKVFFALQLFVNQVSASRAWRDFKKCYASDQTYLFHSAYHLLSCQIF